MPHNANLTPIAIAQFECTEDFEEAIFRDIDFTGIRLAGRSFTGCRFDHCRLVCPSMRDCVFEDCELVNSEFSAESTDNLVLSGVGFTESKIFAVNFSNCNKLRFDVRFHKCLIINAMFCENSFVKGCCRENVFRNTEFLDCRLNGAMFDDGKFDSVRFTGCAAAKAVFAGCEFSSVRFDNCNLEKADFLKAAGYNVNPFTNRLKGARFDLPEALSFLSFLEIDIAEP